MKKMEKNGQGQTNGHGEISINKKKEHITNNENRKYKNILKQNNF